MKSNNVNKMEKNNDNLLNELQIIEPKYKWCKEISQSYKNLSNDEFYKDFVDSAKIFQFAEKACKTLGFLYENADDFVFAINEVIECFDSIYNSNKLEYKSSLSSISDGMNIISEALACEKKLSYAGDYSLRMMNIYKEYSQAKTEMKSYCTNYSNSEEASNLVDLILCSSLLLKVNE